MNNIIIDKTCLSDKYKFIKKIGSGSFGEVYLVNDINQKKYAAKIEEKRSNSRLKNEYDIYRKLKKNGVRHSIPKIITFIETPQYNIMIMQLLGNSLDTLLESFSGKFNLSTVLKLGIEIISILEEIHEAGFLHRDIKPNNFMVGYDDDNKLYIMDFGLSKQYINSQNQHINMRSERSLIGTPRYSSVNVHLGMEPSRRDDLAAVGYMLIYFLKGRLPWQGLKKKENCDQNTLIKNSKMFTDVEKLCQNIPECFAEYVQYCKKLEFGDTPDYEYLKSLLSKTAEKNNIALKYCWCK